MKLPKTSIGKIFNYIRYFKLSRLLLSCMHNGYLLESGWVESFLRNECIDENNDPVPWCPYPYINFLKDNLTKDMTVFEYGSGYSTEFFSARVNKVYSVEHDLQWATNIKNKQLANVEILTSLLDNGYEKSIHNIQSDFDLIIVDGRRRVNCIKEALKRIKPNGWIVLDDSDREKYNEGILLLKQNGYKSLRFEGITPISLNRRETTLFYKSL